MEKLALFGGKKVRFKPYPLHITTGEEEIKEVVRVMKRGILSAYEGSNNEYFMGGEEVKKFEEEFSKYFKIKYSIAVNSATSGLYCAVSALGIGPGDEVIVSPWTMTATSTAILVNNAIPIFADIEEDTFNLDSKSIEKKISPRTKAIMIVHIYGYPANMQEIMRIAKKYNLYVIEDAAQSIGGFYEGKYTGTIGDLGVFSFNCNKIIQSGEGGMVATNNPELAKRVKLIRNHAEAVIATGMKVKSLSNMIGFNYRMGEIEAAINRVQLRKLKNLLKARKKLVDYLNEKLSQFKELIIPQVKEICTHTYYRYVLKINPKKTKIKASLLVKALNAEGMDFYPGYLPLNTYPIYQEQIGYGDKGCPFRCPLYKGKLNYSLNELPVVKKMLDYSLSTEVVRPPLSYKDLDEIVKAFKKVLTSQSLLLK